MSCGKKNMRLDFHADVNRLVFTSHFIFSLVRLPHTIAALFYVYAIRSKEQ